MMFEKGDVVTYAAAGVCKVEGTMDKNVKGFSKQYLVLKPVYEPNCAIYVPTNNEMLMSRVRGVMSEEDIYSLIEALPDIKKEWIDDDIKRTSFFRQTLKSGDRKEIMKMLRVLYLHRQEQLDNGRKFHSADEHFLKEAEHILFDEFAVVLGIEPDEVTGFITDRLNGAKA